MSNASAWAWAQDPGSSTTLLVLLTLAEMAGEGGTVWRPQQEIADKCHLSVRALADALRVLVAKGLVTKDARYVNQRRQPDVLQLVFTRTVLFETVPAPDAREFADRGSGGPTESADRHEIAAAVPAAAAGTQSAPAAGTQSAAAAERKEVSKSYAPPLNLDVLAARIWDGIPPACRAKAKDDMRKVEWALRDAADRGHDLESVVLGTIKVCNDPGRQGNPPAPNWIIDDDRWRTAFPTQRGVAPALAPAPGVVEFEGVSYAVPAGGCADLAGTMEAPGIARQVSWMADWAENAARWKRHAQGPLPGEAGCRIWPAVLAKFGVQTEATGGPST